MAAPSVEDDLPIAEVYEKGDDTVVVTWDEGKSKREAPHRRSYTDLFRVTQADGTELEPYLQTFSNILSGDKWTLMVDGKKYRIHVIEAPSSLKIFATHINSIRHDKSWFDCGKGFTFMGRDKFAEEVQDFLDRSLTPHSSPAAAQEPSVPERPAATSTRAHEEPPADFSQSQSSTGSTDTPIVPVHIQHQPIADRKKATALVYSSVSGSGKTVSMLELKSKLELPAHAKSGSVVVAYLGFNSGLELLEEEMEHIEKSYNHELRATQVLARRLAAATIISINNHAAVTSLPRNDQVYKGYEIPSVEDSKALLLEHASEEKPLYIVAGVDEVQLLNSVRVSGSEKVPVGLGRFFLRTLREWQISWRNDGIRLLPLGTGIAIDWSADPTTGKNRPLSGIESTLITKDHFQQLVTDVVNGLTEKTYAYHFGPNAHKNTVIDLVTASFWPRVRLLEWLRDGKLELLKGRCSDNNSRRCWAKWFCFWLRDDAFSCTDDRDYAPGKGNGEAKIFSLFVVKEAAEKFSVIPDGYASSALINSFSEHFPVPGLYDNLDVIKSMEPAEFLMEDQSDFEKFGFHVVGAAIHVGLAALKDKSISYKSATAIQRKRLGLALWFQDKEAVTHRDDKLLVPKVIGRLNSLSPPVCDYYPFTSHDQTSFLPEVLDILRKAETQHTPVYIRCGRLTCCDYLYFYVRLTAAKTVEIFGKC